MEPGNGNISGSGNGKANGNVNDKPNGIENRTETSGIKSSTEFKNGSETPPAVASNPYAKMPRKVVLHRMQTADSIEDRVFWAIVLWSWCGPEVSESVVIKNRRGYIQRDANENPVPAKAKDLLQLLGFSRNMQGSVSRAIHGLAEKGSIRYEKRLLYPVKEPAVPEQRPGVAKAEPVFIAGLQVDPSRLRFKDEAARTETFQWLESLSTGWKTGLKNLKTEFRSMLVRGFDERGIIIDLEEKTSREEESVGRSSPIVVEEPEPTDRPTLPEPAPEPKPEQDWPLEEGEPEPNPENERLKEIRALVIEELGVKLADVPTNWLCERIAEELDEAPLEMLRTRIRDKIAKITNMGMVRSLAADVGKAFQAIRAAVPPDPVGRESVDAETLLLWEAEYNAYREDEIRTHIAAMGEAAYGSLVARVTREVRAKYPFLTKDQLREHVDVVVGHEIAEELKLGTLEDAILAKKILTDMGG